MALCVVVVVDEDDADDDAADDDADDDAEAAAAAALFFSLSSTAGEGGTCGRSLLWWQLLWGWLLLEWGWPVGWGVGPPRPPREEVSDALEELGVGVGRHRRQGRQQDGQR